MDARQVRFLQVLASGADRYSAMEEAGYKQSRSVMASTAKRILSSPSGAKYLAELQERSAALAVMSLQEKREFLAAIVRTPIGKVDEKSPLCQEYVVVENESGSAVKVKMPSKLEAIKEDNRLAGHYPAEEDPLQGVDTALLAVFQRARK